MPMPINDAVPSLFICHHSYRPTITTTVSPTKSSVVDMDTSKAMAYFWLVLLAFLHFPSSNAAAEAFTPPLMPRKDLDTLKISRSSCIANSGLPVHIQHNSVLNLSEGRGGGTSPSKSPFYQKPLVREMLAEAIGTFLLVQIGTGSVMSAIYTDSLVGLFQIASVWIIAVTVAICTTASISGAHLNPAVSLAFALVRPSKDFGWKKVLPYTLAQLLGALAGSAINFGLYASTIAKYESANGILRATSSGLASAKAFGEYFG